MLSNYQFKIAGLCNIPTGNVKKFVPIFFDKEKYLKTLKTIMLNSAPKKNKS